MTIQDAADVTARRAAQRNARNNAGCLLGLLLWPVWLLARLLTGRDR